MKEGWNDKRMRYEGREIKRERVRNSERERESICGLEKRKITTYRRITRGISKNHNKTQQIFGAYLSLNSYVYFDGLAVITK